MLLTNIGISQVQDRLVAREAAEEWCRTAASATIMGSQPLPHFETSAKTAESVEEAFQEAARRALIYEDYKKQSQPQLFVPPTHEPINLRHQTSSMSTQGNGCCWFFATNGFQTTGTALCWAPAKAPTPESILIPSIWLSFFNLDCPSFFDTYQLWLISLPKPHDNQ